MDSGWTLLHSNSSGAAAASEPTSLCAECACLRVLNNALLVENAALTEEINETAEKLENLREHRRIVDNSYSLQAKRRAGPDKDSNHKAVATTLVMGTADFPDEPADWNMISPFIEACACNAGSLYQCAYDRPEEDSRCVMCLPNETRLCQCDCENCKMARQLKMQHFDMNRGLIMSRRAADLEMELEDIRHKFKALQTVIAGYKMTVQKQTEDHRRELQSADQCKAAEVKLTALQKDRDDAIKRCVTCIVCLMEKPTFMASGCRHVCLCESCCGAVPAGLERCPICRGRAKQWTRVYL